jgi:O-antigen/teichoic acid export membrane protein
LNERPVERTGKLDLRSLWRNASWTSASLMVTTVLSFAETVLLARFLGVALLGLFVLVRAFPEAVQQVLDCRTQETTVKYLGEFVSLDQRDRAHAVIRLVWAVDVSAGVVALAIVLATASLAARYIVHDPKSAWLVAVYAASQFVGTLDSASGSVVRVFDRFALSAAMGVFKAIGRFAAVLIALLLGGRVAALVFVLVGVEAVYTVASTFISVSLMREYIGFRLWGSLAAIRDRRKEILTFLLHTNIAGTLKMSSEKLVLVLVGALGGTDIAAQYKVASQTGMSIMLFSDPFYQVIYPSLSKLVARREWTALFSGIKRLQRMTLSLSFPAAAVASGLLLLLTPLVFGSGFKPSIVPGIVILWGVLPNVCFFWLRPLLLSLNEAGRLVRYRAVASGTQLVLTVALVPLVGALGAAAGLLVMHWLYATLEYRRTSAWRRKLEVGSGLV